MARYHLFFRNLLPEVLQATPLMQRRYQPVRLSYDILRPSTAVRGAIALSAPPCGYVPGSARNFAVASGAPAHQSRFSRLACRTRFWRIR